MAAVIALTFDFNADVAELETDFLQLAGDVVGGLFGEV